MAFLSFNYEGYAHLIKYLRFCQSSLSSIQTIRIYRCNFMLIKQQLKRTNFICFIQWSVPRSHIPEMMHVAQCSFKGTAHPSRAPEFTPGFFWWDPCCSSFYFFCVVLLRVYVLSSVLGCPLRFPHVWLVFISSCFIYVICVCLRIVVSNIYCVVVLFCLSSSCVPNVASFSGLLIFDCPFAIL